MIEDTTMTDEEYEALMEAEERAHTPSRDLIDRVKDWMRKDPNVLPNTIKSTFPDETGLHVEMAWFASVDEIAFEDIVVKDSRNYGDWCLHHFRDVDNNWIVVPINGWTGYEIEENVLTFTFEPGVYHDDRRSVSIRFKDFTTAMEEKNFFMEHFGK